MSEIIIYTAVFILTFGGVKFFRRWSRRRRLFDVPNERSSHTEPTPRGGGLVIAVVCLTAYTLAGIFLETDFRWSYLLGAAAVALISWLDDLYTVSFVWRFLTHSGAALLVIASLGFFDWIYLPLSGNVNFGVIGAGLTFFWIVWLTNAYNFMDGIDGIAGMQAVTAGIGWLLVGKYLNLDNVGFYGGIIAFSSLGFLFQNWQPAKIFMGDVGSAFLGYSFAVVPLLAKSETAARDENRGILLPMGIALVWLFVFDTLWTFGRRVLKREKVWQAHRTHLYQRFVIRGFSHRTVTSFYGALSLLNVLVLVLSLILLENRSLEANLLTGILVLQSIGLLFGLTYAARYAQSEKQIQPEEQ